MPPDSVSGVETCALDSIRADLTGSNSLPATAPMPNPDDCLCPHIDKGDARCEGRFTLGALESAFDVCVTGWLACPHYHRISMEESFQARVASGDPGAALWYETMVRQRTGAAPQPQGVTVAGRAIEGARVRPAV